MTSSVARLSTFFGAHPSVALVEVADAKGSTPREEGAWMLVAPGAIFGTIGGGQLEFMAIDVARRLLADTSSATRSDGGGPTKSEELSIPLGPEIGQCCGGRVGLQIFSVDGPLRVELERRAMADDAARPHVYLFGGGHVGHALSAALSLLPLSVTVVETRAEALEGMPEAVATRLTPVPEEAVRDAPARSAFIVLTHDHALDFLIVAEALKRGDAAYVGMIGSKTKKATFRSWFFREAGGNEAAFSRLITPIGGAAVRDKRPEVIAAMAAAEVMTALAGKVD